MTLKDRSETDQALASAKQSSDRPLFVHEPRSTNDAMQRESNASQPTLGSLLCFTKGLHYIALLCATLLSFFSGLVNPALAILIGKIFEDFSAFGGGKLDAAQLRQDVTVYSLVLVVLGACSWALNACFFASWLGFGELQAKSAQLSVFEGLASRPIAWYDLRKCGVGALIPRIQTQIRELQLATSQPLGYVLHYLVTSITSLGIAFYYSCSLTLVIIASVPASGIVLAFISSRMQPSIEGQKDKLANASKVSNTTFANIVTVKCFNGQAIEASKYSQSITRAARWYVKQARTISLQIGFVRLITFGMFVQGFWYGHHLVATGKTTFGSVVTCFWTCLTATQAVEQVLPHIMVLEKGRAAGAALFHLVSYQHTSNAEAVIRPATCKGQVMLRGVSFAYPIRPEQTVLRNFNGIFVAGETTFLVGQSGSGKSTVSQILMRFYDQTSGTILFDGQRLETLDVRWLRQNVTYVEQQSVLFSGTIRDNVSQGKPDSAVSVEDIKQAVQFALLEQTVVDMPDGLETRVTGKGASLSGGQKQRVALARARLRDAPVLILDESTSALDQISRTLVMAAVRHSRKGKTNIIITHDLAQIEMEDQVYVLEHGKVIRSGYGTNLSASEATASPAVSRPTSLFLGGKTLRENPFTRKSPRNSPSRSRTRKTGQTKLDTLQALDSSDDFSTTRQAFNKKRTSRMSYIPSIFAGAESDSMPTSAQALGSFTYRQDHLAYLHATNRTTMLDRQPVTTRPAPYLSPNTADLTQENEHMKQSKQRRASRLGTELMEMTGMHALKARATMKHGRETRRASVRIFDLDPSDPRATTAHDADLESRSTSSARTILKTVWPTLSKKQRCLLLLGLTASVSHAVVIPIFSYIISKLLATFYDSIHGTSNATKYSLRIIGIAIVDAAACYFMHLLLEYCGQVWVDHYRKQSLLRILDQPLEWFGREENSVGQLTQTLDRNAEEMRNLLGRFAACFLIALVLMSVTIIWSLGVNWKLTLVGLSMGPLSLAITRSLQATSAKMEGLCNDASDRSTAILSEAFTNVKTVRALTLEPLFRRRYKAAVADNLKIGTRRAIYCGIFFGLSEALIIFTDALILWYGARLCASGQTAVQDVLTVLSMLLFSFSSVSATVSMIPQLSSSKDNAARLLELSRLRTTSHEHNGSLESPNAGDVECRDLTFAYPSKPYERILWKITQVFSQGISTAIVGPSGSGKSTIASLLLRLYATSDSADHPQITMNDVDINSIKTSALRSLVTVVPQTPVLFPASIRDNIAYDLPITSSFASKQNVKLAAASAGIADFVNSLPDGYATLIGDGGMGISGGQAQRISIARALVRHPKILILDEATSALDPQSADLVRETVRNLIEEGGLTVIIITHTREMMEIADHVVMLEQGSVVESGGYQELLEKNGRFATMMSGGVWKGDKAKAASEAKAKIPKNDEEWDQVALDVG